MSVLEVATDAWCRCGRTCVTGLMVPLGAQVTTSITCQWCGGFVQSVPPSDEVGILSCGCVPPCEGHERDES